MKIQSVNTGYMLWNAPNGSTTWNISRHPQGLHVENNNTLDVVFQK